VLFRSDFLGGEAPVSASATTAPDFAHTYAGKQPYTQARALRREEIPGIVEDYARAARNAIDAGFDGAQLHAANGYLIDQFLRDAGNQRDDDYGGSPENRVRFLREATAAVAAEIGAGRTAVRLSPNGVTQGIIDSDPASVYGLAAEALDAIGIAFLELRELRPDGTRGASDQPRQSPLIRQHFKGPLVLNSDFDKLRADDTLAKGEADAISFGRPFIGNPDLALRLARNAPLNEAREATFYSQGSEGYTDYPALDAQAA
jgi:2,4-dienoyl-CoA reductase-like NADH-dependent reductase (Old Yellow Enzyme family)